MSDDRETLTYELFGTASRELAQHVVDDGWHDAPTAEPASLQGPAASLRVVGGRDVLSVEFYTGVDERLDLPVVLPPTLDRVDLTGAKVLVADDVADTGKTLELVRDFCSGYVAEVRTAVIYEKPQSVVSCDYVWRRSDRWINFPWSTLPPVVRRSDRPAH